MAGTSTQLILFLVATVVSLARAEMITPEAIAKNRAEELKKHLDRFDLNLFAANLNFDRKLGGGAHQFYRITLTTGPLGRVARRPYVLRVGINQELAGKVIDHLLADGYLERSAKYDGRAKTKRQVGPGYIIRVRQLENGFVFLEENLGFDLKTLERLTDCATHWRRARQSTRRPG